MIVTIALGVVLVLVALVRTQRLIRKEDAFLAALRTSQQRFDYVVSGTNDGIWDWSLNGTSCTARRDSSPLLGYAPGTLRETAGTFLRRMHAGDRRELLSTLREHLTRGDPFDLEARLRVAGGGYRWFRLRGRSVPASGASRSGWRDRSPTCRTASERKRRRCRKKSARK